MRRPRGSISKQPVGLSVRAEARNKCRNGTFGGHVQRQQNEVQARIYHCASMQHTEKCKLCACHASTCMGPRQEKRRPII